MSATQFEKSIGRLAREAAVDIGDIVSKEVKLGQAEITDNIENAINGVVEIVIGAAILIPALTLALLAAAYGLATIEGVSQWAGALIVAVIAGLGGYALLMAGRRNIGPKQLFPQRMVRSIRRDADAVKEAV